MSPALTSPGLDVGGGGGGGGGWPWGFLHTLPWYVGYGHSLDKGCVLLLFLPLRPKWRQV